jgi:hypothetical protein
MRYHHRQRDTPNTAHGFLILSGSRKDFFRRHPSGAEIFIQQETSMKFHRFGTVAVAALLATAAHAQQGKDNLEHPCGAASWQER